MGEGVNTQALANYNKGYVIYSVKVENGSAGALSDVRVKLFMTESIFKSDTQEQAIALIRKGEASTVKFTLRPRNVCGVVEVQSRVRYFDTASEKDEEIDVPRVSVEISCPELTSKKIDAETWEEKMGELMKAREEIQDIGMSPDSAFEVISESIKDMNMALVEKKQIRGVPASIYIGKFYGVSRAKGVPYGVKVEIMGETPASSRVNLTAYAQDEKTMCGCVHRMLDEVEARLRVKDKILFISQGDMVFGEKKEATTLIQDSVLSRTAIGPGEGTVSGKPEVAADKCRNPDCGNLITGENKALKCRECGKRFCTTCESRIKKSEEFHGRKLKFRYPLCEGCYVKSLEIQQKGIIDEEQGKKAGYDEKKGYAQVTEAARPAAEEIIIISEVRFLNGLAQLKVAVMNDGMMPAADVALDLNLKEDLFRLERIEPDLPRTGSRVRLGNLGSRDRKAVTFYLDPLRYTESPVEGVVTYRDGKGQERTIPMDPQIVVIAPNLRPVGKFDNEEIERLVQGPSNKGSKLFAVPEGITPNDAFATGKKCMEGWNVSFVQELERKEPYKAEAWYYAYTGMGEVGVMILTSREEPRTLEFHVAASNKSAVPALLARFQTALLEAQRSGARGKMEPVADGSLGEKLEAEMPLIITSRMDRIDEAEKKLANVKNRFMNIESGTVDYEFSSCRKYIEGKQYDAIQIHIKYVEKWIAGLEAIAAYFAEKERGPREGGAKIDIIGNLEKKLAALEKEFPRIKEVTEWKEANRCIDLVRAQAKIGNWADALKFMKWFDGKFDELVKHCERVFKAAR